MIFDSLLLAFILAMALAIRRLLSKWGSNHPGGSAKVYLEATKVGGTRKKVRFSLPKKGRRVVQEPNVRFLDGPRAAARRHPAGKSFRFAQVQGRHEFDQEGFSLLLSRYSQSTAASYQSQWGWWSLFCKRRGEDPVRYVPAYSRQEEQLVIDFLVHCASNEAKAPGTIKLRLSAIRSMHLTLGYPDLLMHMPRIPLALAGLRRRFGTKERRMPVTPDMLKWLGEHLQYGRAEEASLLWGALTLGFFFLLRASEYLDVGYQDPRGGLRGSDVTLKLNGNAVALNRISEVDEVTLLARGSKTDIYNRGQVRNHFRTAEKVCVAKSVRAAKGLGLPEGDLGAHSLVRWGKCPVGTVPRHLPSEALGTMGLRQLPNLHMGGARDCQRRSTENDHGRPHSKLTLSIRIRDAFRVRIPEGGRKPKMGKGNGVRTPEFEPSRAKRVLRAGDSLGKGNLLCSTQCARGFLVTKLFHL